MKKVLASLVLLLASATALSQTPTLDFSASTTTGAGSVSTTLTWNTTPAAQSCVASGHASWTGTKPASGTADLPPLTLSGSYNLTLVCTWPGDTTATLKWVAPTTNTDGSALAKCANSNSTGPCLAYFQLYRRVGSTNMNGAEVTPVRDPLATTYVFTGLGAGTHNFAVEVMNGNGTSSALSNIAAKVITTTVNVNRSVTITVNPQPGPAVLTSVE